MRSVSNKPDRGCRDPAGGDKNVTKLYSKPGQAT